VSILAIMRDVRNIIAVCVCMVAVWGCSSNTTSAFVEDGSKGLAVPDSVPVSDRVSERIKPLDVLSVKVFNVDDLSGTYQVDHLGRIKMPLVGTVESRGYTGIELASVLERRLSENYLQDPDVSVIIEESNDSFLTVEGSVASPGMFPVRGKLTLLQAVALAGGPTENANPRRVVIFRQIEGERRAAGFNLVDIRNGKTDDPVVYSNDVIIMDGSETRQVWRDTIRTLPLLGFFLAL